MTWVSVVNSRVVGPIAPCQQEEDYPIIPTEAEELEFEEASPYSPGVGRRMLVIVLAALLATAALAIIALTFVQGSWWYTYGTDQALGVESQARVAAIRDEVDASGAVPRAVVWLDAALDPNVHPTDARAYLLAAQEAMKATGDPKLVEAARELRAIMQTIRSHAEQSESFEVTGFPYLVPTLELPE